jgi:IclR family acetate operon transcriptional repressor
VEDHFHTVKDEGAEAPADDAGDGRRQYSIAAVDRVVRILDAIAAGGIAGRSLTEVARGAGLSESTALRYLSSLGSHDYVARDPDSGRFTLGLRLFGLGQKAVGVRDVRIVALPHMERLLERYQETVNLAVRRGHRLVIVDVLESTRSIRRGATIGEPDVWHASALGKAMLAGLPDGEAREELQLNELVRFTPRTLTDADVLVDELGTVRERGYAIDDEEYEDGLRCVGAAVLDRAGRPAYGLSISGVASRMSIAATHQMGLAVREAADAISAQLGFTHQGEGGDP